MNINLNHKYLKVMNLSKHWLNHATRAKEKNEIHRERFKGRLKLDFVFS